MSQKKLLQPICLLLSLFAFPVVGLSQIPDSEWDIVSNQKLIGCMEVIDVKFKPCKDLLRRYIDPNICPDVDQTKCAGESWYSRSNENTEMSKALMSSVTLRDSNFYPGFRRVDIVCVAYMNCVWDPGTLDCRPSRIQIGPPNKEDITRGSFEQVDGKTCNNSPRVADSTGDDDAVAPE